MLPDVVVFAFSHNYRLSPYLSSQLFAGSNRCSEVDRRGESSGFGEISER